MISVISTNKVALFIIFLVVLSVIALLAFAIVSNGGDLELAGTSTFRYCVGSGSVCTGTGA